MKYYEHQPQVRRIPSDIRSLVAKQGSFHVLYTKRTVRTYLPLDLDLINRPVPPDACFFLAVVAGLGCLWRGYYAVTFSADLGKRQIAIAGRVP